MTAERALAEFLERERRVERDPHFLAKVARVVFFGSMLNPEVQRGRGGRVGARKRQTTMVHEH
jgi:hypothetical protein